MIYKFIGPLAIDIVSYRLAAEHWRKVRLDWGGKRFTLLLSLEFKRNAQRR